MTIQKVKGREQKNNSIYVVEMSTSNLVESSATSGITRGKLDKGLPFPTKTWGHSTKKFTPDKYTVL
jgi:hypothetical protein